MATKAILKESLVEEEVLTTVLTEVQLILNSRPLCAVLIPMNTNL